MFKGLPNDLLRRLSLEDLPIPLVGITITPDNLRVSMDQIAGLLGHMGPRLQHFGYDFQAGIWKPFPENPHTFIKTDYNLQEGSGRIVLDYDRIPKPPINVNITFNVKELPVLALIPGANREVAALYLEFGEGPVPQGLVSRDRRLLIYD
jgi:hypothetical protein